MQQGKDMTGRELQGTPKFLVGATTTATTKGKELEAEVENVKKKKERGAAYFSL